VQKEWEIGGGDEGEEGREEEMTGRVRTQSSSSPSICVNRNNCCGWGCIWRRKGKEQQSAESPGLVGGPGDCPREPEEEATRRRRSEGQRGGGSGHRIFHASGKEEGEGKKDEEERRDGKGERMGRREVVVMVARTQVHRQSKRHFMCRKQRKVLSRMGEEEEGEEDEAEEEDIEEENKEKEEKEEGGGEEIKCISSGGDEVKGGALLIPRIFTSNTTASAMAQAQMVG